MKQHGFWWWFQAMLPGWQIVFFLRDRFCFDCEMKERRLRHEARMKEVKSQAEQLIRERESAKLAGNMASAAEFDRQLALLCLSLLAETVEEADKMI